MTKTILAISAAALAFVAAPALGMGGGGSGGGGYGGTQGYGSAASAPASSDYQIGVRLIHHEQYADAVSHLELALADKPHDADILNYLGYAKRMLGDYDASLDFYQRALQVDPNHKGVHEYLGELYLQKNDLADAQKELTTLASLCPSGCDERDTLTKAIANYTAATAAPAAAPSSATPAATPSTAQ
jgi:Flp pilus assembly protein TadD